MMFLTDRIEIIYSAHFLSSQTELRLIEVLGLFYKTEFTIRSGTPCVLRLVDVFDCMLTRYLTGLVNER